MTSREKPVIYVDGEPYVEYEDKIGHPEHALIEGSIDVMQEFMGVMIRPAENLNKAFKYLLRALTLSG